MPCRVYFPPWADMFCPVHCTTLMRCLSQESLLLYPCQGTVKRLTRVHTRKTVVKKHDMLALLREMPDDIDTDDLMHRLYLRQKLEAAEAAVGIGDVIPHDEVMRRSDVWLH